MVSNINPKPVSWVRCVVALHESCTTRHVLLTQKTDFPVSDCDKHARLQAQYMLHKTWAEQKFESILARTPVAEHMRSLGVLRMAVSRRLGVCRLLWGLSSGNECKNMESKLKEIRRTSSEQHTRLWLARSSHEEHKKEQCPVCAVCWCSVGHVWSLHAIDIELLNYVVSGQLTDVSWSPCFVMEMPHFEKLESGGSRTNRLTASRGCCKVNENEGTRSRKSRHPPSIQYLTRTNDAETLHCHGDQRATSCFWRLGVSDSRKSPIGTRSGLSKFCGTCRCLLCGCTPQWRRSARKSTSDRHI